MEKEKLENKQENQKNKDNSTKDIKKNNLDSENETAEKENSIAKELSPEEKTKLNWKITWGKIRPKEDDDD